MRPKKRLGEMLLESGLLTEEQLQQALASHKKAQLRLGQYLIRESIISEHQLVDELSRQLRIAKYHPDDYPLDPGLAQMVPQKTAQQLQAAPLKRQGRLLTVAMVDPLDIDAMDTIEVQTSLEIEAVVCTEQEIGQILNSLYGMHSGLDGIIDSMNIDAEATGEGDTAGFDVQVSSLKDMAEEAPVIRLVNSLLAQAVREGASDIHISPQQQSVQVRFRVDGRLHDVPSPPKSLFLPMAARLKILASMDITVARIPQDGRFTLRLENREINVRVSSLPTIYGENMVLRLLNMSAGVYTLNKLGMVAGDRRKIERMSRKPYGMILSTGPTGSGKSTSLYAIINEINQPDIHIVTLEDPVEYRINNIRQCQLNRKAGMTFASGLRAILRQDPDVVMVGEIRDAETAAIAVQAAQTGHRLLSTLHTNDAAGAITRFIDMGVEPFLVASVLLVSFAQRLVRTICPYCVESWRPPEKALVAWGLHKIKEADFKRGRGCYQCMDTGYKGRTGIFEVLANDDMVQEMILRRCSAQEITRAAKEAKTLRTLQVDAAVKVLKGITTLEEAASAVMV